MLRTLKIDKLIRILKIWLDAVRHYFYRPRALALKNGEVIRMCGVNYSTSEIFEAYHVALDIRLREIARARRNTDKQNPGKKKPQISRK